MIIGNASLVMIFLFIVLHFFYACSPGLNARKDTDAKVIQHCFDADVFVYVANGKSTFDTGVSTFVILFNQYFTLLLCYINYLFIHAGARIT